MSSIALGITIIGLILLIISNAMYTTRTKENTLTKFWLGKDILIKNEYILNRVGFGLALFGLVSMFALRVVG